MYAAFNIREKHMRATSREQLSIFSIFICEDRRGADGQLLLGVLVYPFVIQYAYVLG